MGSDIVSWQSHCVGRGKEGRDPNTILGVPDSIIVTGVYTCLMVNLVFKRVPKEEAMPEDHFGISMRASAGATFLSFIERIFYPRT